jgi:hypothetical protein
VIGEPFRAMNTKIDGRASASLPRWANVFPYVNGGLFSGSMDVPRFSRIARSYLLHIGSLDWTKINPDIFGSMIQAVAEDEERGALGMHYTSAPNILKVLNPLFLDDLHARLDEAGDNSRPVILPQSNCPTTPRRRDRGAGIMVGRDHLPFAFSPPAQEGTFPASDPASSTQPAKSKPDKTHQ